MERNGAIAILGTFDSKGDEHFFLKQRIESRNHGTVTVHVGTKSPSPFPADYDLFNEVVKGNAEISEDRDRAIHAVLAAAQKLIKDLFQQGEIAGIISAGGGTGTHLGTGVMRILPLGVPKLMISTVASRDMSATVGIKDITMMHSVADILGINTVLGKILDQAAGAICGMVDSTWHSQMDQKRVALTMFGFITPAAEQVKACLEEKGYEVTAFHANGTGGMAMEALAREGLFDAILDLATHELADELKGGYCRGIGPERLEPIPGKDLPRLVIPGGLDCAVLEFNRQNIPSQYRDRKIFFYDFRSAVRLDEAETRSLARQVAEKLNLAPSTKNVLIPMKGWSEADRADGPLYDIRMRDCFLETLQKNLNPDIPVTESDLHINEQAFAELAAEIMDRMIRNW